MFDIGFWELALIGVLALIVLGPKRLPEAARTAGHLLGKLRAFVSNVKDDFDRHMEAGELDEFKRLKEELEETRRTIGESSRRTFEDLHGMAEADVAEPTAPKPVSKRISSGKTSEAGKASAGNKSAKRARKKTGAKKRSRTQS